MIDRLNRWWRSLRFILALVQGNSQQARTILQHLKKSQVPLTRLEQLFLEKLEAEYDLKQKEKEILRLKKQLQTNPIQLPSELEFPETNVLTPDPTIINHITENFKLVELDDHLIQCTGIDREIFNQFESSLSCFIQDEFKQMSRRKNFITDLEQAIEDIKSLKIGGDPEYSFELSPHIYLMRYFLDNVYCAYLAWFLIYKSGLLPLNLNMLDIAAGPGTMIYGLDLLLRSSYSIEQLPNLQVCYYSLEKQSKFQYRGLQFWRKYVEQQPKPTNAYFRFDTSDLLTRNFNYQKIPDQSFDLVIISHCLFYESTSRKIANSVFQGIFSKSLKTEGYVLFIIQDKKLFNAYNFRYSQDSQQEQKVVELLIEEMGLKLVWYKHLTSTGLEKFIRASDFGKFARENLPTQTYMSSLLRQYFKFNYDLNYTLDDYIILAKIQR